MNIKTKTNTEPLQIRFSFFVEDHPLIISTNLF